MADTTAAPCYPCHHYCDDDYDGSTPLPCAPDVERRTESVVLMSARDGQPPITLSIHSVLPWLGPGAVQALSRHSILVWAVSEAVPPGPRGQHPKSQSLAKKANLRPPTRAAAEEEWAE